MVEVRRRLLGTAAGALGFLFLGQAALGQPIEMRAFRDQVLEVLRRKYPHLAAEPGEDDDSIEVESATINLSNIHARVRSMPSKQREAAIVDFLDRVMESPGMTGSAKDQSWPEARKLLHPRLMAADHVRQVPELLHREFAPGVVICYVIDHPRRVEYVVRSALEQWAVDLQQVHDVAVANLEASSVNVAIEPKRFSRGTGLFATIEEDDSYDAARLLLPKFRARLLAAMGLSIFVGIPCRDVLVACTPDFVALPAFVEKVAEDFRQEPYPITDAIFVVDRHGVRPATAADLRRR